MTKTELKSLIASGEGLHLDFKESVNSDLGKSIASFANSKGGQIILGIKDSGEVIGHTLTNAISSKIQDSAQACDPAVDIDISKVDFSENTSVTVVTIPPSEGAPHRSTKGYFLRQGSSSIKMGTDQLIQYINAKGRLSFDDLVHGSLSWKRVFKPMLIDLYFTRSGIPWSSEEDQVRVLRSLRAISADDIPTNAGILFFSETPTDYLPQSSVTCVAFKGLTKTNILDRQTLKADILSNVDDSLLFLKKHLNFSRIITKGQGRDELEIPETALREAVVNAIIHRDYNMKGGHVSIEVYDDRVEVSSPGSLPPGLDEKDFGKRSLARNGVMSDIMSRTPYMEKLGSGIQRISESLKGAGLEEAVYDFSGFIGVVFNRLVVPTIDIEQAPIKIGSGVILPKEISGEEVEHLWHAKVNTGQVQVKYSTSSRQVRRVVIVIVEPMKRSVIQEHLSLVGRDNFIKNYLNPAIEQGFVEMTIPDQPSSSKQRYRLTEDGRELQSILLTMIGHKRRG